jgi:hypothetical protein
MLNENGIVSDGSKHRLTALRVKSPARQDTILSGDQRISSDTADAA